MSSDFNRDTILDQIPAHVFATDTHHRILYVNSIQAKNLNLDHPDHAVDRPLSDFMDEPLLSNIIANNQLIISTKKEQIFIEQYVNPNGSIKYMLSNKKPLFNDKHELIGVTGLAQELSSSVISSETYQHINSGNLPTTLSEYIESLKDYYLNIIDHMPGNVYWLDTEGVIQGINNNILKLFNLSDKQEHIGKTYYDIVSAEEAELLIETHNKVISHKQPIITEETISHEFGQRTYFSSKTPLLNKKNEVIGILGTAIDISKRKQIEKELVQQKQKAEAANLAKNEFLLNMSHDLRTPCSGILGHAKILHDNETDPSKKQQLSYLVDSSNHLLSLLNEIIDHTKIESQDFKPKRVEFNLPRLINQVKSLLSSELQRKKLLFVLNYPDSLPQTFISDPVILHRIILNIVSNAIKFTDQGSVTLSVTFQNDRLKLVVADTGIGIAREDQQRIFEKFTRLSASYDGKYQGTGLGLATVSRLIDSLQGMICLDSTPNVGSTFTCSFPMLKTLSVSQAIHQQHEEVFFFFDHNVDLHDGMPMSILALEDDNISRHMLEYLLTQQGHDVTLTQTGQQALNEYQGQYRMIIMDIGLPDMSGFEFAHAIRAWEQAHTRPNCFLLALTAHINDDFQAKCLAAGIDCLMHKPLTTEKILQLKREKIE